MTVSDTKSPRSRPGGNSSRGVRLLMREIWAADLFLTRGQIGLSILPALLAGLCLGVLALGAHGRARAEPKTDRVDVEVALAGSDACLRLSVACFHRLLPLDRLRSGMPKQNVAAILGEILSEAEALIRLRLKEQGLELP